jgi:hypothetical protein
MEDELADVDREPKVKGWDVILYDMGDHSTSEATSQTKAQ